MYQVTASQTEQNIRLVSKHGFSEKLTKLIFCIQTSSDLKISN